MNSLFNDDKPEKAESRGSSITGLNLTEEASAPSGHRPYEPPAEPESLSETIRRSGLAYAAALTLFASVVFMLLIGWFIDLLAGSAPWGAIGGIVLGAVIGFVQFFRLTSRIFKK